MTAKGEVAPAPGIDPEGGGASSSLSKYSRRRRVRQACLPNPSRNRLVPARQQAVRACAHPIGSGQGLDRPDHAGRCAIVSIGAMRPERMLATMLRTLSAVSGPISRCWPSGGRPSARIWATARREENPLRNLSGRSRKPRADPPPRGPRDRHGAPRWHIAGTCLPAAPERQARRRRVSSRRGCRNGRPVGAPAPLRPRPDACRRCSCRRG